MCGIMGPGMHEGKKLRARPLSLIGNRTDNWLVMGL